MSSSPFYPATFKRITKAGSPRSRRPSYTSENASIKRHELSIFVEESSQDMDLIQVRTKRKNCARSALEDHTNMPSIKRPRKLFESLELPVTEILDNQITCYLHSLPREIIVTIFKLLPALSRGRLCLVCSRWNILSSDARLLNSLTMDSYGTLISNSMKHSKTLMDYILAQKHPEITVEMRCVLIDWMIEVGEEFKMHSGTIFLAVSIIDRYLSRASSSLPRNRFQLLGITAILVASKLEEMCAPTISDLVYVCDNTYSRRDIIDLEGLLVNTLCFDLTIFTTRHYIQHLIVAADDPRIDPATKLLMPHIANYLVELALLDYSLTHKRPSLVASSAIYLARLSLSLEPWPSSLQYETYYSPKDLEAACHLLHQLFQNAPIMHYAQAAFNKYSKPKYQRIATRELGQFRL